MSELVEVLITIPFSESMKSKLSAVSPRLKLHLLKARTSKDVPEDLWQKVEVLYTDRVLPVPDQVPNLSWIQFHWAGIDHIVDSPIMRKPDLVFTTLSGASSSQIAEYVVMMLMALGHHLPGLSASQSRSEWPADRWQRFIPKELRNSTVGIIGYGSIGRQVARLLQPFGAQILAIKRDAMHPADSGFSPEGLGDPEGDLVHRLYPPQALRSMVKDCDFVVVTVPLTPETRQMIGEDELAAFKDGAYLIDVSRGGVVDHSALIPALGERKLAGAALDVFPEEPLPAESPLWKLPNVIITPHISGMTRYYDERAVELFAENLHRYLAGLPLYNRFNLERGY